jgi:hypothetical protein
MVSVCYSICDCFKIPFWYVYYAVIQFSINFRLNLNLIFQAFWITRLDNQVLQELIECIFMSCYKQQIVLLLISSQDKILRRCLVDISLMSKLRSKKYWLDGYKISNWIILSGWEITGQTVELFVSPLSGR